MCTRFPLPICAPDGLKSGNVKPVSCDEVIAHFREKGTTARRTPPTS